MYVGNKEDNVAIPISTVDKGRGDPSNILGDRERTIYHWLPIWAS